MKHIRIVTRIVNGHWPSVIQNQLGRLIASVKDGTSVVVEVYQVPRRRTAAQSDAFHAMVRPWAAEEGHVLDALKADLLGSVFGWQGSPLGQTRVPLKPHTSALTVEEFSELMTRTVEIAADCGYLLQLPSEYSASKWMPESMKEAR